MQVVEVTRVMLTAPAELASTDRGLEDRVSEAPSLTVGAPLGVEIHERSHGE